MRRNIIILLMLVLPLQYVWAAAAQYCGHEVQSTTSHFGHHEHEHVASSADSQDGGSLGDPDCMSCHFAHCTVAPATFSMQDVGQPEQTLAYVQPYLLSRVPSGLERPQRSTSLPAVRFGSGWIDALTI